MFRLTLVGNFACFLSSIDIFFLKIIFFKIFFQEYYQNVQRLSAHNKCRQRVKRMHFARLGGTHGFYNDKETFKYLTLRRLQKKACSKQEVCLFVCFCCFTSHVNSYGHCGTVSSLNHTFSWAGLSKRLTSNLCTYFRL